MSKTNPDNSTQNNSKKKSNKYNYPDRENPDLTLQLIQEKKQGNII